MLIRPLYFMSEAFVRQALHVAGFCLSNIVVLYILNSRKNSNINLNKRTTFNLRI